MGRMRTIGLALLAAGALAACGGPDGLRVVDTGEGPDEFTVLPQRPLLAPPSLDLPPPTPGAANRADPDPLGEAIAALGGSASAAVAGGVPAGDAALVAAASRNGTDPAIRATLAGEDAAFRQRQGFARAFNPLGKDQYFPAYARFALDAYAELARFRAAGVAVPSAPPQDTNP